MNLHRASANRWHSSSRLLSTLGAQALQLCIAVYRNLRLRCQWRQCRSDHLKHVSKSGERLRDFSVKISVVNGHLHNAYLSLAASQLLNL